MEGKQRLEDEDQLQSHKDSWDSHIYAAMVTGEEDLKDMNGGTCSMAVLDGENHIEAVTVSFAEAEDEVRSTLCFAQSKSDLEGKRNDTQKDVDDVITSPGGQKFSAEVMSPVSSGCVYLDIEEPRMETSEESLTPSCDIIMVGFEPMQNNSPSISELQNVVNSTFHAASPMDRNKVGREVQESTENVITSTKNESSNSDKFLTDDREIETVSGRSSPGTGSCSRSQVDCTFDTSSDLTTNHSQSSLLSVTSIDTLDYSLPSSQPDCPSLSKGGSISIQESKMVADDLSRCSESEVCRRSSRSLC
ncbi:hypothetical protein BSL78_01186 [Apostichopus japonicus]|uniref:Uncharacterized protein n=1 Tax=Stichopus japonicus TaxID=307972 RepID=A0A2G8LNP7_STIJA|nr:hypothetical protein BSL78_01186 [Apostichopus japonicus]